MSEAMTNREIEDVLSSIRRLVAQDPVRAAPRLPDTTPPGSRLILTEAQRIDPPPAPVEPAPPLAVSGPDLDLPAPDFGRLEATIAELEAAVSASGGGWEGELVEEAPRASNVTDLYGRLAFTHRPAVEEGPVSDPAPDIAPDLVPDAVSAGASAARGLPPADPSRSGAGPTPAADPAEKGVPTGEAIPGGFEQGRASRDEGGQEPARQDGAVQDKELLDEELLDEAALRALIAQIVREELHGQLGERITAQVRKLVRAEIAKALDERRML